MAYYKDSQLNINGKRNFKLKKLTEPNKDSARGSKAANKDTNKKKMFQHIDTKNISF